MERHKKLAFSRCPQCAAPSYVIDTRDTGEHIRRRRKCSRATCSYRWTTKEVESDRGSMRDILIMEAIEKLKQARQS